MKMLRSVFFGLLAIGLVYISLPTPGTAQNPTCPTRPLGDKTNACASTAFVANAIAAINTPEPANTFFAGPTSGADALPTWRVMDIRDVVGYTSGVCAGQLPVALTSVCGGVMFNNAVSNMKQGAYLLGPGAYPQSRQTVAVLYDTRAPTNVSNLYWGGRFDTATAVTFTVATSTVNRTAHGYVNGGHLSFGSSGTLPTGVIASQLYYVINATANTFQISLTPGGSAVAMSGTPTGTAFIYGSVGEQIYIGDNTRPEFGFAFQNVQNIGYRAISVNYFNGAPAGFVYSATSSASQGIFRSTSGPYWECTSGASSGSTCTERGPYIEFSFGGSQTLHTYLIESDVANSEVFVGYMSPTTDTYASNVQQNGFYRSGSGTWKGRSYNGVLTDCDTGLTAESGRTVVLVMAYVSQTQSAVSPPSAGIDFFAGYEDTSPVYRCHIAEANVSSPTPQLTYFIHGKNTSATSVTFHKTHSEAVMLGQ